MVNREDNYRHKGLRKKLVEALLHKGIKDKAVLDAIGKLPRHFFLDPSLDYQAYEDKALPIKADQTISQPYTVAFMTELLKIQKHDKVLELGTGSGYQAAVLSLCGANVYTVERQETLFRESRKLLLSMNFNNIKFFYRDGTKGLPEFAPYDKIIVTAACNEILQALLDQLAPGGMMVIPVGDDSQQMLTVEKSADGKIEKKIHGDFRFVPFLPGTASSRER
ncbi:MAG TPA: protein-L-isoaspartate(D-aspartate) O-methyltransferase [Saprospiraceae bacterium]|nr:protein-L-isoaspartate(D-aspartate) O-methyltransferase [Saprospiraceae bacterium]HMX83972.1 protein-L-isoaspartate(D-aspartate) O-methyltransferase [Saprospiraceae bacterium]HMX86826.1 protein-L-isoaspartate(D-aspartate) O-methyltransferase [Saprospiraceae bacterium]HMZ74432.1 protein-L-isoaspartate(D-aspartate) O-methyltransferase [Saprospiraceae bacterium]HNA94789.1 protein-L-isoaspartate(D-aspartate) O-methyltransferase [Saprospiraceae bacterium]